LSDDDGRSWSDPVRIVDWGEVDGGYPSCVELSDGQVLTVYYAGDTKGRITSYHMGAVVWDPDSCKTGKTEMENEPGE
jgi:hypothetical protein